MTVSGIFDNEASSVDLKVYDDLRALGWSRESKTLLYQPKEGNIRVASPKIINFEFRIYHTEFKKDLDSYPEAQFS